MIFSHCLISCLGIFKCTKHEFHLKRVVSCKTKTKIYHHVRLMLSGKQKKNLFLLFFLCCWMQWAKGNIVFRSNITNKFIDVRYRCSVISTTIILLTRQSLACANGQDLFFIIDQFLPPKHYFSFNTIDKYLYLAVKLYLNLSKWTVIEFDDQTTWIFINIWK